MLPQTATLRRLALYFDVGSKRWSPPTGQWKSMARSHWEAMFRPSVSGSGPTGGPDHLYILAPVNGRLTYDHINGKLREKLPVRALALSSPLTGATPVPYPLAFRPASHPISTCLPMQHSARTMQSGGMLRRRSMNAIATRLVIKAIFSATQSSSYPPSLRTGISSDREGRCLPGVR